MERVVGFARQPVAGKVKTRLAAEIGDEAAVRVYESLLGHRLHEVEGFASRLMMTSAGLKKREYVLKNESCGENGGGSLVEGVCEVEIFSPENWMGDVDLLIEIPHGATRRRHFESIRKRLVGQLPENLIDFFFVNTDVGAPEVAEILARRLADEAGKAVMVLRSLVPRTFIDCNRAIGDDPKIGGALNAALPDYITDERDKELLLSLHQAYLEMACRAYRRVCGAGHLALALHTYAPISVDVEEDEGSDIVSLLHQAYEPGKYESWPVRPEVDIISKTEEGNLLAPEGLVALMRENFASIGVEALENDTYHLHPMTMAHEFSLEYPGKVICVELGRASLAEQFTPFAEMQISREKAARMAVPVYEALRRYL